MDSSSSSYLSPSTRSHMALVQVQDLLGRDEIVLDESVVSPYVDGKTVLVTGGGGSIGSELCRQLVKVKPRRIIVFDIYENTAYELMRELNDATRLSSIEFIVEIGSIRDEDRVKRLFDEHEPQLVFHAAAHKHVPLMEHNPREAVLNNVFGTLNVLKQAHEHHSQGFVFISTDKAVNPTSVMGATKRIGEMLVQCFAKKSGTVFSAVRFGNVLGSHGSVLPLFEHQIQSGGPLSVTHKDIVRYFMTIPEAARLVISSGALATGGEIFVLNMGEPIRIYDLAERLITLSGYRPHIDIPIEIIGLRPGEKLYEELFMDLEQSMPTQNKDIMISSLEFVETSDMEEKLARLLLASRADDKVKIKQALVDAVETYVPTDNVQ